MAWPNYVAISPYFLIFLAFGAVPVVFTLFLAFNSWNGLGEIRFVGLENFGYLLQDELFARSVYNTLVMWVMSTVPCLSIATVVAVMLNAAVRFSTTYKIAYFLPNITSLVAMGILFGSIFSSQFGIANGFLQLIGVDAIAWMRTEWGIKIAISALSAWSFVGYNALIILAGLQAISKEVYEAASIDGAGVIKTFFYITLPQLRPILLFVVVMSTIGGLQSFTEAQVLTSANSSSAATAGGLGNSGLTMVLYFYAVAFQENRYGYAAAIAWGVFIIVMLFTIINWRLARGRKDA